METLRTRLKLRLPKCSAWSRSISLDHPCMFRGLAGDGKVQTPEDGFTLLGAPIGFSHFEAQECLSSVKSSETLFDRLTDLPSLQIAMLLLRHCACPRIQFLLAHSIASQHCASSRESHADSSLPAFRGLSKGFRFFFKDVDIF